MITLIIIGTILIIYLIVKAEKKEAQKVDPANPNRNRDISQLYAISLKTKDMGSVEKVLSLSGDKNTLSSFSYSNLYVHIRLKNGTTFDEHLDNLDVTFNFDGGTQTRTAEIKNKYQTITILENSFLLNTKEWDQIFHILSLARVTHLVERISNEYRTQAIVQYKMMQQNMRMQRTMRMMRGY